MQTPGYHISEIIYESRHSLIYRAQRESDGLPVVLKQLKGEYPPPDELARFRREYEMTRTIQSSGIIEVYELLPYQHTLVIVVEDFGGDSLAKILQTRRLTLTEFFELAIRISESLATVHARHVMHKDINPSNIVWNPETGQLKLIDFGISTTLSREQPDAGGADMLEGTPAYISPEQTGRMNRAIDYRTDLYSLGATLYEMLTGKKPFECHEMLEWVHAHIARTPVPPHQVLETSHVGLPDDFHIPPILSVIILTLMKKNADERYQSASGLKTDLQKCLEQLQQNGNIVSFDPRQRDLSDRLHIPQKLYGRKDDIQHLLQAFERVATVSNEEEKHKQSELLLITGPAGIGKTSLISEIRRPVIQKHGYFIAGKFDQFSRNTPYSAIVSAFQSLTHQILSEPGERISQWKQKIVKAVGPNGQLIIDVIPEVEHIIGEQATIPELPPQESQNRFIYTFHQFIQSFAGPKHPLVIFLDDLQWADASSLKLIENWQGALKLQHALIIGAYRDDEIDKTHQLTFTLDNLRNAGSPIQKITLSPLSRKHIEQLLTDTLKCKKGETAAFAELCFQKTHGNPFFLCQLLVSLHESTLLNVDLQHGCWQWDLEQIRQAPISENVVALMSEKIQTLPERTLRLMKFAACIGNQFSLYPLTVVSEQSSQTTSHELWPALQAGFIIPLDNSYKYTSLYEAETPDTNFKFLHDRIQQAAYQLIQESQKHDVHLKIGRLLLKNISEEKRPEYIFDIVRHLNEGRELIHCQKERIQLGRLNLIAGKRAKASTAYKSAREFLLHGLSLSDRTWWKSQYELMFSLYKEAAETAFLCGDFKPMEELLSIAQCHAQNLLDNVAIYEVKIQADVVQNNFQNAIKTGLDALQLLGVHLPSPKNRLLLLLHFLHTRLILSTKRIENLIQLPQMRDPYKIAASRILMSTGSAAFHVAPNLLSLIIFKGIHLCIKYGNPGWAAFAYGAYGFILCGVFGNIESGHRFGKLAINLQKQLHAQEFETKILLIVNSFVRHWKEGTHDLLNELQRACQIGLSTGDIEYAGYSTNNYLHIALLSGEQLHQLKQKIEMYHRIMVQFKQMPILNLFEIYRGFISQLIGEPESSLQNVQDKTIPSYEQTDYRTAIYEAHLYKSIQCYLFQNNTQASENAAKASFYLDNETGAFDIPVFHFYESLICLALYFPSNKLLQMRLMRKVKRNQKKIKRWARHAPMNHLHKWHLVEAEKARVLKKDAEAMTHYDVAIQLAKEHEFLNEEALANELAARFYLAGKREKIAKVYMQEALYCYQRWGALAKVRHLEQQYPKLLHSPSVTPSSIDPTVTNSTQTAMLGSLDLAAIMKSAQALSGTIEQDRLMKVLLETLIESTGTQKGVLILRHGGNFQVEAYIQADHGFHRFKPPLAIGSCQEIPAGIVRYTANTLKSVVLDETSKPEEFVQDSYLSQYHPRSLLCAPILYQNDLRGILYLEHRSAPSLFTLERRQIVTVLCAQVAISLEHVKLYRTLERQQDIRREKEASEAENRAKSEFLRTISHEIRNPLNAITLGLSNLTRQIDAPGNRRIYLKRIDASSKILQNLVNSVLDLSSIEACQFNPRLDSFNIRETISTAIEPFHFELKEGVEFTVDIASNIPICVYGDGMRITQVLTNLVSNAVKFTTQGKILLKVTSSSPPRAPQESATNAERTWLHFLVQDSGPGIPEEELASIFKPYFQGRESLRRKTGGTGGIGMTIVKKIVNAMGGEISLQSHPGFGTQAHVLLPFSACTDAERVEVQEASQTSFKTTIRVLIVEDNHSNRFMLSDSLSDLGCHVAGVEDGEAALERWQQEKFDVILMDKQMPGMDGIQATRKIRSIEKQKGGHTHIIALTASVMNSDKRECLQAGMDDYLPKPVDMPALLHKLNTLFPESNAAPEEIDKDSGFRKRDNETELRFRLDQMPASWKNNPAKRKKFIALMKEDIQQSLQRLEQAIQDRDFTAVSKAAHKLKGAVGKLRSEKIQKLALQLEINDDIERASTLLHNVKDELERILGEGTR